MLRAGLLQVSRVRLLRATAAEFVGTAFLLAAVVGSGIMAERLAGGNDGVALLANSIATGGALVALITTFAPLSGAHFNPLITLVNPTGERRSAAAATAYVAAQTAGALTGVVLAHAMFEEPLVAWSQHSRSGVAQLISEAVATFGLVGVVVVGARRHPPALPVTVGAYVLAAYWFTASTSFANPVVTIARTLTDTFTGIRPADAPGFLLGQAIGAALAVPVFNWLDATSRDGSR
jgi:glycerol uptake facilitator-like aquaporin